MKANIVLEGTEYSYPAKVSVWVDPAKLLFAPIANMLFCLTGRVTVDKDDLLIEATRFYPACSHHQIKPPVLNGTAVYKGKPEEGTFILNCSKYAVNIAAEIKLICKHNAKQYVKVESTIRKDQEIFFFGFLDDYDNNELTISPANYSYLGRNSKKIDDTVAAVNAVNPTDNGTPKFSPRKKARTEATEQAATAVTPTATAKPRKRTIRNKSTSEPDAAVTVEE